MKAFYSTTFVKTWVLPFKAYVSTKFTEYRAAYCPLLLSKQFITTKK